MRELEERIERQRATVGWASNAFYDEDVIRGEAELARLKGLLQELRERLLHVDSDDGSEHTIREKDAYQFPWREEKLR